MSRASVLALGRAAAEAGMVDRCTIRRPAGTTEDADGNVVQLYATLYTDQRCRAQTRGAWGQDRDVGQAAIVLQTVEIQLPVTEVTDVGVNDEIEMTAAVNDPALEGRIFRVRDAPAKSEATARRLNCTSVTG